MDVEQRYQLVVRNSDELINEEELRDLLTSNKHPVAYIGFEPSGLVHLGWALVVEKICDLCAAGFKVIIFWADWHAFINDKLGGNLENIRACAKYMEDCFTALGVPKENVSFRYASELVTDPKYWENVINIGKSCTMARVKKSMTIMGRSEDEAELDSSKLMYPLMQVADIFSMGINLAYAGMDQRRVHMLARDVADKCGWAKPIALHTPLLPGLSGGNKMNSAASKMSKSKPNDGIKIHDSADDIRKKMSKAFCSTEQTEDINPVLMICKSILFPKMGKLDVSRPDEFGGSVSYSSYEDLKNAYFSGNLHPVDLKKATAEGVIEYFKPVREFFKENPDNLNRITEILETLKK